MLENDEALLKDNFEKAYEKFQLSTAEVVLPNKSTKQISYKENENSIEVLGENYRLNFDKSKGIIPRPLGRKVSK